MTTVAVWYEPYDKVVWAVADTRVSHPGPIGGTITDGAAKILPLSLRCFQPGSDGFFSLLTMQISLGFAYSGSTLAALTTYAVANTCLQNLISTPGAPPPSVADVASLLQRIAERYVREVMSDFEAIVFGWCRLESRYRAIIIAPDLASSPRKMCIHEQALYETDFVSLLGTHKEAVMSAIKSVLQNLKEQELKRAPKLALQSLVSSGALAGIGGTLQIGTATPHGFDLKSYVRPINPGQPQAARYFLGIDIDQDIGLVGGHAIGMTGTI